MVIEFDLSVSYYKSGQLWSLFGVLETVEICPGSFLKYMKD